LKQTKSKKELATLVADAVEEAISTARVMPPFIEGHIRDGMSLDRERPCSVTPEASSR
jgi:hypothetical protein